jgi:hypothetical protein
MTGVAAMGGIDCTQEDALGQGEVARQFQGMHF